jgi:hypothetical protein
MGKEKVDLIQQSQEFGLQSVRFLPPVTKNEMADVFAGGDGLPCHSQPYNGIKKLPQQGI